MCDIAVWYKTNIKSYILSGSMNLMGLHVTMMCICFFINLFFVISRLNLSFEAVKFSNIDNIEYLNV